MREPYALAGLVLLAGAAEEFEHALVVAGIDAAPVVGDLEHGARSGRAAAQADVAWPVGAEVLHGVFAQVGEQLFDGHPVVDDVGQGALHRDHRAAVVGQVAQAVGHAGGQHVHRQRLGIERAPPFARELEDGVDQPVHLAGGGADEADRLGDLLSDHRAGVAAHQPGRLLVGLGHQLGQ